MNINSTFLQDLRSVLIPERKWHYVFHVVVILTALFYWVGSLVKVPEASWPEIVMYRPYGDNELCPVITSLSKFNFGDPTDAVIYGKGLGGHHMAILAPNALAAAIFGSRGYMVADAVLSWLYFVSMVLFLRRCNFGNFASFLMGSALATCGLQALMEKLGDPITKLIQFMGYSITDWAFPNLVGLQIFAKRIPRPMVTEIILVLLFYFILKVFEQRKLPSLKSGVAVGAMLAVIMQGDPFSFAAVGLVLGFVMVWIIIRNRWRLPWAYMAGGALGAVATGWIFLLQRIYGNPDLAGRAGLGKFPRNTLVPLPGYGPLLRVAVICVFAGILLFLMRRRKTSKPGPARQSRKETALSGASAKTAAVNPASPAQGLSIPDGEGSQMDAGKAAMIFAILLVVAGWLAQPVQVFLLGSGAQIYHYLINTLPAFYAFALVIVVFNCFLLALPEETRERLMQFGHRPGLAGAILLLFCLLTLMIAGNSQAIDSIQWKKNARQEGGAPWLAYEDNYRPALRELEKEFRENAELKKVRTISTFNCEVSFLLTGFYDKRSYTPFMGASCLRDDEVENRLCEMGKVFGLSPDQFVQFVSQHYIMNYWLGAAKYWFASDYKFSTDDDYTAEQIAALKKLPKQSPFVLVMPISERQRLNQKYYANLSRTVDVKTLPEAIVLMTMETKIGLVPSPTIYTPVYTNLAFAVFKKTQ